MSGAIHKITGIYTLPEEAHKEDVYICLCHNEPLIVRRGEKNVPHYSHFPNTKSTGERLTYTRGENVPHIDAKHILHNHIERKQPLTIVRRCYDCEDTEDHIIPTEDVIEVCLEKVLENGSHVHVYMQTPTTSYCFQVYSSSRSQPRPEPFYELRTEDIHKDMATIVDMNTYKCTECKEWEQTLALDFEKNKQEAIRIALLNNQKVFHTTAFSFGKYKTQQVRDVIKKDPLYCLWILKQQPLTGNFVDVQTYLRSRLR